MNETHWPPRRRSTTDPPDRRCPQAPVTNISMPVQMLLLGRTSRPDAHLRSRLGRRRRPNAGDRWAARHRLGARVTGTQPAGAAPRSSPRWRSGRRWWSGLSSGSSVLASRCCRCASSARARSHPAMRGSSSSSRRFRRGVLLRPVSCRQGSATGPSRPGCGWRRGPRRCSSSPRSPARWRTGSASGRCLQAAWPSRRSGSRGSR
jgi:hypothetical protein